jgi:type II secretory pathway pseudopilin PulG
MAIDLYSKATLDTLLAAKLTDAPSDGIIYGRKDGSWYAVYGAAWGAITGTVTDQTDLTTYLSTNYYPASNPSGFISSVPATTVNQVTGGPYTLAVSDANNIVRCTSFAGNALYLPDDSTAAIPVGSRITILVDDITNLPVSASGSATLLWNYGGPININNTNGGTAVKVAADTWFLMRP